MADFLKECQVAEFQDAFTDVADKGGFIASSQLGAVLRRLGQNPTDAEIQVSDDSHLSNHTWASSKSPGEGVQFLSQRGGLDF